jgi:hypothetical protein
LRFEVIHEIPGTITKLAGWFSLSDAKKLPVMISLGQFCSPPPFAA